MSWASAVPRLQRMATAPPSVTTAGPWLPVSRSSLRREPCRLVAVMTRHGGLATRCHSRVPIQGEEDVHEVGGTRPDFDAAGVRGRGETEREVEEAGPIRAWVVGAPVDGLAGRVVDA